MAESVHFMGLAAEIDRVHHLLENAIARQKGSPEQPLPSLPSPTCPALDRLCSQFGLSAFERNVLVLCAGWELIAEFGNLMILAQGDEQLSYPTWNLAYEVFENTGPQTAIAPAPLYTWKLIEVRQFSSSVRPLALRPLQIDPSILGYLAGKPYRDNRLAHRVRPVPTKESSHFLVDRDAQIASDLTQWYEQMHAVDRSSIVQLYGDDTSRQRQIAAAFCHQANVSLYRLSSRDIPDGEEECRGLLWRWHRHARLNDSILLLEVGETQGKSSSHLEKVNGLLQGLETPTIVSACERLPDIDASAIALEVPKLTFVERKATWASCLGDRAREIGAGIDIIADLFPLSPQKIDTICHHAATIESSAGLGDRLWEACRTYARTQLDALAQRVETNLNLDDLVLPPDCTVAIEEIIAMARYRCPGVPSMGFCQQKQARLGLVCPLLPDKAEREKRRPPRSLPKN